MNRFGHETLTEYLKIKYHELYTMKQMLRTMGLYFKILLQFMVHFQCLCSVEKNSIRRLKTLH